MKLLYRVSSVLWIIWGLVHVLAGVMTMKGPLSGDIPSSIAGIADGVAPESLQMTYPNALGAIVAQHGFNLFWIGVVTFLCAYWVWKGNKNAIFLAALIGGLADLGYFLFLDLGGYVNFVPGSIMTIISALAIIISFYAHFKQKNTH